MNKWQDLEPPGAWYHVAALDNEWRAPKGAAPSIDVEQNVKNVECFDVTQDPPSLRDGSAHF
jgi:hypothetical protein